MGGVGPGIGDCIEIDTLDCPLFIQADLHPDIEGVAHLGADHAFLAVELQSDRDAVKRSGEKGDHWLQDHILLLAETAADRGFDNPQVAKVHVKGFGLAGICCADPPNG